MSDPLARILKFEVPIIVLMGTRQMPMKEVLSLVPGMIMELPKSSDEPLELCVNNKAIGTGSAVKVGENFGIKVDFIGTAAERVKALGNAAPVPASAEEAELAAMAEQMLSGQM